MLWNDPRAPGCALGGPREYYDQQSDPSKRGIKSPSGIQPNPGSNHNWLSSFGDTNFNTCGVDDVNVSYIQFSLNMYALGPPTTKSDAFDPSGNDHRDDGQYSTRYLRSNQGDWEGRYGRARKILANGRDYNKRYNWIRSGDYHDSEWRYSGREREE